MSVTVEVRDLRKAYAGTEAVRGVSFTVARGEVFGLLGPNGAGKTTTVECLVGLREPDAGELIVCGLDARKHPRAVKEKIGVALQTTSLQDKITPREALAVFGAFYAQREEPAVLLERFALTEKADAPVDSLSGGQRQRLALAMAFVNRPELVFLDEPTTGLDPQARREVHEAVLRMKREGYTVLLTTHQLGEAETLCDRVAIIDRGRIVAAGTPRELMAAGEGATAVTLAADRPLPRAKVAALPGAADVTGEGEAAAEWRLRTTDANATLAALAALLAAERATVVELQVRKASLEDVFLRLTQSADAT